MDVGAIPDWAVLASEVVMRSGATALAVQSYAAAFPKQSRLERLKDGRWIIDRAWAEERFPAKEE